MLLEKILIKNYIRYIIQESSHIAFCGKEIPLNSEEAVLHIEDRIKDATRMRNACKRRSEERSSLNILLRYLRRMRRKAISEVDNITTS